MIRQYLPQTNESTTIAKSKKFSELNKALVIPRTPTNPDGIDHFAYTCHLAQSSDMVEQRRNC